MISLGAFAGSNSAFMYLAYMSLFGLLFQLGSLPLVRGKSASNGYITLSILGTLVLLIVLSFNWIWHSMVIEGGVFSDTLNARSFYLAVIISASALVLFLINYKEGSLASLSPFAYLWAIFVLVFVIGLYSSAAPVLVNIMVLLSALYIMREGNLKNHLGLLNFGLLIIAIQAFCRFLDTDLSFVVRGLLFIVVGVGFFLANYYLLKKRKSNEIQ